MRQASSGPRRRVLALAESAHPEAQSVSWIGWALSRAVAERHDLHLVTRKANRAAILAHGLREGVDFTAIDLDWLEEPILRLASRLRGGEDKGWTTLMALSLPLYYAFEAAVWRQFRERLKERRFDVVHRITPVSPTMPSLIATRLKPLGVPFVLGPINGGLPWPAEFKALRRNEHEWLSSLRALHRAVPGYAGSRRHAAAILAGSLNTLRQVPPRFEHKCIYMPENGIDPSRFPAVVRDASGRSPLRALFVGRLVSFKGCDMAIRAAAPALRDGRLKLTIVGDGPERQRLEELVAQENVGDSVRFAGLVAPVEVRRFYAESDILLFPSVREFGGGVVLEAMTMGVVPVVVDHGGPGELVVEGVGLKVPLASAERITTTLRTALDRLLADPQACAPMAAAGRRRVDELFTWQRKAEQLDEVYAWVSGRRRTRPAFGFLPPDDVEAALSPGGYRSGLRSRSADS